MKLTAKQDRFCEEYMVDLNATQAAIRAGYAESGARTEGARLLANANIADRISELKAAISERNRITVDECIQILANIARADIADFYDENGNIKEIHSIPKESRDAIEEFSSFEEYQGNGKEREFIGYSKKIKASGKQAAIDKLLKHLGGYEMDNKQKLHEGIVVLSVNPLLDGASDNDGASED